MTGAMDAMTASIHEKILTQGEISLSQLILNGVINIIIYELAHSY